MKFITAEQFSKADKMVRYSIMEWWEPSVGDLYISNSKLESPSFSVRYSEDAKLMKINKPWFIPLLAVGQLIEFIEWKTKGRLDIRHTFTGENILKVWTIFEGYVSWDYEITGTDTLINGLWDMVQKVCE